LGVDYWSSSFMELGFKKNQNHDLKFQKIPEKLAGR
jgi:hypothetical protein